MRGSRLLSAAEAAGAARARTINKLEDFRVKGLKFGIAISWDQASGPNVDLDLQGLAFDASGKLLDAVYYNNLKALGRGLTHSGDETTGERQGYDEVIWVNMTRLPEEVCLVVFVAACFRGGHLSDASNGRIHILEESIGNEVGQFLLAETAGQVSLVGGLIRLDSGWIFRVVEVVASGQHFIDILEPTIGNFVRSVLPHAPKRIKAAFAMDKGSVVDLPQSHVLQRAFAGLGWDTTMGEVDLDVSAVLLDSESKEVSCVFFGNQASQGVTHSGDNLTGQGSGDDEVITIDLEYVPPKVHQLVFVINVYSKGKTFLQVANPYCRLVTSEGEEFCRYQLTEAGDQQALIMARLFREPGALRWGFQAMGMPCTGRTYKDSMPTIVQQARKQPREVARMFSMSSLGDIRGNIPVPMMIKGTTGTTSLEGVSIEPRCGHGCVVT